MRLLSSDTCFTAKMNCTKKQRERERERVVISERRSNDSVSVDQRRRTVITTRFVDGESRKGVNSYKPLKMADVFMFLVSPSLYFFSFVRSNQKIVLYIVTLKTASATF